MQFVDEFICPLAPDLSKQRKVVILKQEDADAPFFMQHPHFAYDLSRLARTHYLSRRGAVEGVNGAERTGPRTTPASDNRHDGSSQHGVGKIVSLWIRKTIQILDQCTRGRESYFVAVPIGNTVYSTPVLTGTYDIRQFEQRRLAFKADDTVKFRH